jgi:hypothetical protein
MSAASERSKSSPSWRRHRFVFVRPFILPPPPPMPFPFATSNRPSAAAVVRFVRFSARGVRGRGVLSRRRRFPLAEGHRWGGGGGGEGVESTPMKRRSRASIRVLTISPPPPSSRSSLPRFGSSRGGMSSYATHMAKRGSSCESCARRTAWFAAIVAACPRKPPNPYCCKGWESRDPRTQ